MANSVTLLKVFVASPDDVSAERDQLEDVINELNLTIGKTLGLRLELVRWETNAFPGMGIDSQEVIN